MGLSLTDLKIRHALQFGLKVLRSNPEKYCREIFQDANNPALEAVYGKMPEQVANWIKTTEIPIILGFDLTEARLPAITVHLSASSPSMPLMGDEGLAGYEELGYQDKEVLVPSFVPEGLNTSNPDCYILTPPSQMPFEQQQLFLPGLLLRDANNREYSLGANASGEITVSALSDNAPLAEISTTSLEVVSPVLQARYGSGAMVYDEVVTVAVHANASRSEGVWLSLIVQWIFLKFRPLLAGTLNLDLSMPSASDLPKDESFLGENVWVRYFTINSKAVLSWGAYRQKDVLGYLVDPSFGRVESDS